MQVTNAPHTRRSFLERSLNPLLSANKGRPYTLAEALREVSATADKLSRFGKDMGERREAICLLTEL